MVTNEARILLLVPYFGAWPEWIEFHLATARWNRSVEWLYLGDHGPPGRLAPHIRFRAMSLDELRELASARLGRSVALFEPYKVCDLRPAFGALFEELVVEYDYFGWSDIDVLYGDLRRLLGPELGSGADILTFNEAHLSGHLTLLRRGARAREICASIPDFSTKIEEPSYQHLDEPPPDLFRALKVSARESFNTPLSRLIPWRDGRFVFPTEWRWRDGSLTNDLDGDVEHLYLHFMHWKGGWWARECGNAQWERFESVVHLDPLQAELGFRVDETGFHPLR